MGQNHCDRPNPMGPETGSPGGLGPNKAMKRPAPTPKACPRKA